MKTVEVSYEPIIDILEDILGECRSHNEYKHQISFDCPVCSYDIKGLDGGDGKGNLEVNYGMGVYKCWSCGETHETHGSIYKLIKTFGNQRHIKRYKLLKPEDDESYKKSKRNYVKLPKEFISLSNVSQGFKLTHYYKEVMNYLKNRNITDEMISKYNIGFCYTGFYSYRVIIPSYDDKGFVNYFIGRSYEPKPKLKYRNPEAEKEQIIWNEHLIDWDKPVFLVEGVFDHIFLPNSIPMLGKKISEKLFKLLYEKANEIIIILDPDAHEDAEKIYYQLNGGRLFDKVWVLKLYGNCDIADLKGEINLDEKIKI